MRVELENQLYTHPIIMNNSQGSFKQIINQYAKVIFKNRISYTIPTKQKGEKLGTNKGLNNTYKTSSWVRWKLKNFMPLKLLSGF